MFTNKQKHSYYLQVIYRTHINTLHEIKALIFPEPVIPKDFNRIFPDFINAKTFNNLFNY
jgi:hypothetical protein